jgi:hypothetical protein
MSSKRGLRRKECGTKARHASEENARVHWRRLMRLERSSGQSPTGKLCVYLCRFCGSWHVGHMPHKIGDYTKPQISPKPLPRPGDSNERKDI